MLSLSQTTGYAVRALGCLSDLQEGHLMAREIADCTGVPLPYLSKVLNALVHAGLVRAKRGYRGGFSLAEPLRELSLRRVADAVEGPEWGSACLLGLEACSDADPCPAHAFWSGVRRQIEGELDRLTVADMAEWERRPATGRLGCCGTGCAPTPPPGLAQGLNRVGTVSPRTVLKGRKRS